MSNFFIIAIVIFSALFCGLEIYRFIVALKKKKQEKKEQSETSSDPTEEKSE